MMKILTFLNHSGKIKYYIRNNETNKKQKLKMGEIKMENIKNWNIENITGYTPLTTYYMDFGIAERFGKNAIIETYNRAKEQHKNDYKILTELVMVLNWKIWEHYETNETLARIYNGLWEELDNYCCNNLKDEELAYFYATTD